MKLSLNYVRRKLLNEPQSCLFFQLRCFILVTQPQPILLSLLSAVTPAEDWQGWNSYAAWCHLWQLQIPLLLRHWGLCSSSSNHRSHNIRQNEKARAKKPRCILQRSVLVEPPREAVCPWAQSFIGKVWIVHAALWEQPERTEKTLVRQGSWAGVTPPALSGQRVGACARCGVSTSPTLMATSPWGDVSSD